MIEFKECYCKQTIEVQNNIFACTFVSNSRLGLLWNEDERHSFTISILFHAMLRQQSPKSF